MKLYKLAAACSLIALIATMGSVSANQAQRRDDATGLGTLGFDVSGVWSSPEKVHKFLTDLDPASRVLLFSGCASLTNSPFDYNPKLRLFCDFATAAEPEIPAPLQNGR